MPDNTTPTKELPKKLDIRLYTHNIRYATSHPFKNELPWPHRAPLVISSIRLHARHNPESLICLQEVLHSQLLDILEGLGPEWAHIGVGRDDGQKAGEYSPILFRYSVWAIEKVRSIWLSETPEVPSKGWDASNKRILTSVLLRHWETGVVVLGLNTHLDDQGVVARLESGKIILKHIADQRQQFLLDQQQKQQQQQQQPQQQQLGLSVDQQQQKPQQHNELPIFLAGDFNSTPDEEAYKHLTTHSSPIHDLRNAVGKSERYGHDNTFTGFESRAVDQKRIDFLFLSKGGGWKVGGYGVLETRFEDGVFSSDHRPVVGDVSLSLADSPVTPSAVASRLAQEDADIAFLVQYTDTVHSLADPGATTGSA
ncbi:endonuclease/exonuclease/phosphatase [Linnemannia elongata]|nr:endonuclease/exonuclease/phosphatase [Linnemannia elongata]